MNIYIDNSRMEIYATGKQDLREFLRILRVHESQDKLEEFIIKCGPPLPSHIINTYDYEIDMDTDDKSINFA